MSSRDYRGVEGPSHSVQVKTPSNISGIVNNWNVSSSHSIVPAEDQVTDRSWKVKMSAQVFPRLPKKGGSDFQ